MKSIRKFALIGLLTLGAYSACVPPAYCQVDLIFSVASKIFDIGGKVGKSAAILTTVNNILKGTDKLDDKLGSLKGISSSMSGNLSDLWKTTDKFYKDLKKISQGVSKYKDMLRFVENTRAVYGYCGSAITLSARSNTLTLTEHEYIIRNSVEIQEYVQQRIGKLLNLISSDQVSMNDYERMQLLNQIADDQMRAVRAARALVARVKGMELRHDLQVKDQAFREDFLNMKL